MLNALVSKVCNAH